MQIGYILDLLPLKLFLKCFAFSISLRFGIQRPNMVFFVMVKKYSTYHNAKIAEEKTSKGTQKSFPKFRGQIYSQFAI